MSIILIFIKQDKQKEKQQQCKDDQDFVPDDNGDDDDDSSSSSSRKKIPYEKTIWDGVKHKNLLPPTKKRTRKPIDRFGKDLTLEPDRPKQVEALEPDRIIIKDIHEAMNVFGDERSWEALSKTPWAISRYSVALKGILEGTACNNGSFATSAIRKARIDRFEEDCQNGKIEFKRDMKNKGKRSPCYWCQMSKPHSGWTLVVKHIVPGDVNYPLGSHCYKVMKGISDLYMAINALVSNKHLLLSKQALKHYDLQVQNAMTRLRQAR